MSKLIHLSCILLLLSCGSKKESPAKTMSSLDELKSKLEVGFNQDQSIRKEIMAKMKKGQNTDSLHQVMSIIDSSNQVLALSFLESYGWPKISEIGKPVCYGIFYIVQHGDLEIMKTYLPQLQEMAEQGEAKMTHFAMMKDRVLTEGGKKQIYGTQAMPRKDENGYITNEYYIWPIENVEEVNTLRKEIGFKDTIEEYAEKMDAEFNKNETLIN